jgi:hypothetical protein
VTVHDLLDEVADRGWFTAAQKKLYGLELGLALTGDAAGYPLVAGPFEIFEEVCEVAGLRRNVRAYYHLRFERALDAHVEQLAQDLGAEEAA